MQRPLHDIRHQLDNLARAGKALVVSIPTDAATGSATNIEVPVGQTFVVTKIWSQGHASHSSTYSTATRTGLTVTGLDAAGDAASYASLLWPASQRLDSIHAAASPSHLSSIPDRPVCWEPSHPIVIASKWSAASTQAAQTCGGVALYGYLIGNGDAATLGLETSGLHLNTSGRRIGFAGVNASNTDAELIPARAGYSIKILDIYYRSCPLAHVPTHTVRLYEDADATEDYSPSTTDRTVFLFTNNNPDVSEYIASPGLYLTPGVALRMIASDANVMASVNVIFEYVPSSSVPKNHWWSFTEPALPTPALGTIGTSSLTVAAGTTLSLYYPATGETKTTPLKGQQHVVEGVAWSIQKDLDATSDHVIFAVTTGSAVGTLGLSAYAITQSNYLITPMLMAGGHDQNLTGGIDRIRIPCPKDDGLVMVEALAVGSDLISTPSNAAANVDEWAVTAWGETVPATYGIWHFKGSAS